LIPGLGEKTGEPGAADATLDDRGATDYLRADRLSE